MVRAAGIRGRRRPAGERRDRVLAHAAGACAVGLLVVSAGFGGLHAAGFADGGLDLAWHDSMSTSDVARSRALASLALLLAGMGRSVAGVALLTALVLVLGSAADRRSEAATRGALGAAFGPLAVWAVRRQLAGFGRWALAGASVGLGAVVGLRAGWPGPGHAWPPPSVFAWAVLSVPAVALLMAGCATLPLAGVGADLRRAMGTGATVLSRYPTGLRWLLPVLQISVTGGLLAFAGVLARAGSESLSGGSDVPTLQKRVLPIEVGGADASDRSARLRALLDDAADRYGAPVVAATPGALLGLGPSDLALAECGQCAIGGLLVPIMSARVRHHAVSPDTFSTLGVGILEGRDLSVEDGPDAPPVALVNQALARAAFHDGGPVGRHVRLGAGLGGWYRVVGVVAGTRLAPALGGSDEPAVFLSALQRPPRRVDLFLPAVGTTAVPPDGSEAWSRYRLRHAAPFRWTGRTALALGGTALVLSLAGLVAVMAHIADRRRREVAVRMALGADARTVARQLTVEGARLTAAGLVGAAWVTTVVLALASDSGSPGTGIGPAASAAAALLAVAGVGTAAAVARTVSRHSPARLLAER